MVVQKCLDNGVFWGSNNGINEGYWNYNKDQTVVYIRGNILSLGFKSVYITEEKELSLITAQEFLRETKFKVGDKVRGTNNDITDSEGIIIEVKETGYVIKITKSGREWMPVGKIEDRNTFWENALELVSSNNNITLAPEKNKGVRKLMSIIKDSFKSKEKKATDALSITNGSDGLTGTGREEFIDYLWETMTEVKKDFIAKVVEEYEKVKKDNK